MKADPKCIDQHQTLGLSSSLFGDVEAPSRAQQSSARSSLSATQGERMPYLPGSSLGFALQLSH